MSKKLIRI